MKQKTLQQANAFATIEIAESKKNSQIGIKERESTTRQKNAELETQAITIENETKQKIAESQAQLDVKNAETMRIGEMARISAQKDIEIAKIELMEQSLRNRELSQAKVNAEVLIKKNEGDKRAIEIESDAKLYAAKQDSEAKKLKADAELYFQQKNAEGIQAIYESQAKGLQQMLNSLNGDTSVLLKIRGIDTKLYETLAKEASNAVQGMQPKINIWNTGNQSDKSISNILSGIVSGIPPMLDALQSQTDISFSKKSESLKNHIESKN
jgi:flotillin